MRRCVLILAVLLCSISIHAQVVMPEKMAKSVLIIRPGVLDLGDTTVEKLFLNKKFISKEQLDGSIATSEYGSSRLEGNTYYLDINFLIGEKITGILTFVLAYQEETTLLQKVIIKDTIKMLSEESSNFGEMFQILNYYASLQKKE